MKNGIVGAILIVAFCVAAGQADDGRMSQAKLSKYGLSSMKAASDDAGLEVRGKGKAWVSGIYVTMAGPSSSWNTLAGGAENTPRAFAFESGTGVSEWTVLSSLGDFFSRNATATGFSAAFAP